MKISIGSDHGGFDLKEIIKNDLLKQGYEVKDFGCYSLESVDYPVFAKSVARSIQNKDADFGVLICTTGIGMSIAANKFRGIRAALVCNLESSILTRKHNNSNIICLSQKFTKTDDAISYVNTFLKTDFEGGRHERRVNEIEE